MLPAVLSVVCARGQAPLQLVQLNAAQIWRRVEFRVDNAPPASNPFDPDGIRLDATFMLPSGRTNVVPAFWYQGYQRILQNGSETVTAAGSPEWRIRFTPSESGEYAIHFSVLTNGQPYGAIVATNFS